MKTQCSSCKAIMPVKNPAVFGKTKTCPKCGNQFRVVEYGVDSIDDDDLGAPEPPSRRNSRSKRKSAASAGNGKLILIGVAVSVVVLIGTALGISFFGGREAPTGDNSETVASSDGTSGTAATPSAGDSLKNRRAIGLAMHNYQDTHRTFPHPTKDHLGRSGLSWRVHLLPLFDKEHRDVYQEFHLDEPWDSPHNRTLIERMPAIYETRGVKKRGFTGIRIIAGPGTGEFSRARTFFQVDAERGPSFREATDGPSNTVLFVEVGPEAAVEWTKPEVLPFICDAPMSNWGTPAAGIGMGFNIVLCDGRPIGLSAEIGARETAAVLLCNDGNIVQLQTVP